MPELLSLAGVIWAGLAVLDPRHPLGAILGPLLTIAGLGLQHRRRQPVSRFVFIALLATALAIGAVVTPHLLGGDSAAYYVSLRSLAFDRDLDFANEWRAWRLPEQPLTSTGHRYNQLPVGPAILWSPFFLVSHVYVVVARAVGASRYPADGYSDPYLRSMALGTISAVVLGAWLLMTQLARLIGKSPAVLGVLGAILTSPVLYYVYCQPGMAHGLGFALSCGLLWAWLRARDEGGRRWWIVQAVLLALLAITRLQAVVFLIMIVPLAIRQLRRKELRLSTLAVAVGLAFLIVLPQLLTWKVLYGSFFRIPEGPGMTLPSRPQAAGWFKWTSPHFSDVLFSADHGLFTWTPAVILGMLGLVLALRRQRALAIAGLLIFAATTWLNGARTIDWAGDDAFGARRFELVMPFVALGFAVLVELVVRRPLIVPVTGLFLMTLWNAGFIRLFRTEVFSEAAPFEAQTARQVRQLQHVAENAAFRIAGSGGRAFVYNLFVGEFFYWNLNLGATISLGDPDPRYLAGGWSEAVNRNGPPTFRFAHYPSSCVRFPLKRARRGGLRAVITARAPRRLDGQTMTVVLNGAPLREAPLGPDWSDVFVMLPEQNLVGGENQICLKFSNALPAADGPRVAAAVSRIQLP